MQLYSSAANHISHHLYKVFMPVYAMNQHPDVMNGTIDSLYQPFDPAEIVEAHKSIVELADMRELDISFEFHKKIDFIMAYGYINAYLAESVEYMSYPGIKEFLNKIIKLRKDMDRGRDMIFREHPDWAEKILGLDTSVMKMLEKFSAPSGKSIKDNKMLGISKKPVNEIDNLNPLDTNYNIYDSGL